MSLNRRASDQLTSHPAHFEGRMSSLETDVRNQGKVLGEFIQESRKTTSELFNGLNRLSDAISGQRATNWQQLGVMLTLASAVGGFIYVAFVAPLQAGQRKALEDMDRVQDAQIQLLERVHQNQLEIRVHMAREGVDHE
jgi:hypothetical protein